MDYGSKVAQQLQSFILNSKTFDSSELCIIQGKFCWNICVDLLVLQMDGDPLDACSIATYVALNCTKIPKVEIFLGESGSPEDFEVNGDLGEALSLQALNIPICISSSKVTNLKPRTSFPFFILAAIYVSYSSIQFAVIDWILISIRCHWSGTSMCIKYFFCRG